MHIHAVTCIFLRMQVGIAGASGYAGAELLRLCAGHPELEVVVAGADTQAGQRVAALYPSLAAAYPSSSSRRWGPTSSPGSTSSSWPCRTASPRTLAPGLVGRVGLLVDLSADFRLRDPARTRCGTAHDHVAPELLGEFVYGLPELFRAELAGARWWRRRAATRPRPALALAPLVRAGVIETTGIIVDAASGVSGAGRKLSHATHFNTADEDFTAYGLLNHRHTPEIEQAIGAQVLFTPHLAPMNRGILATCYARPTGAARTTEDVLGDPRRRLRR